MVEALSLPSPPSRRWPSSTAAPAVAVGLLTLALLAYSGRGPSAWSLVANNSGGGKCASGGGHEQQTRPAAGARCILYAHKQPECLYLNGQEARPCNFPRELGCLFEEAARMQLDVPRNCRVQAMADAVAAGAAAWQPAQLQGGLPPPQLASLQRRQQKQAGKQQQKKQQREGGKEEQQPPQQAAGAKEEQQEQRPFDVPGSWGPPVPSAAPGWQPSAAFRPDGCPTAVTGAAGLVGWAQATGMRRIVMVGDSTMRQLFQRVATLARAQPVTVDVVSQRYAHYTLGWAAAEGPSPAATEGAASGVLQDALWFSHDTYPEKLRPDWPAVSARMQSAHSQLTARSRADAALPAGMRSRELTVDLVVGTFKGWQPSNVQRYLDDVRPEREETAFVLHVCYWEGGDKFWPDYVSFLRNLAASARHVVVLTCPVAPGWRDAKGVAARNADLRRLMAAEAKSGRVGGGAGSLRLLDVAAMVEGAPLSATKAENDVHYQCGVFTTNGGSSGGVENALHDGPYSYRRFDTVHVDRSGTCEDAVNFAVWQQLLCELAR